MSILSQARPPRDGLVRARPRALELRASEDGAMPTLVGRFAVFNQWTRIDSLFEGLFMERIAPGAFAKTIREQRDDIKVLFQHGHDPMVGDKPLGPIDQLEEDRQGARYEVPLIDTSYNRDMLIPGLEAGLYGASFRFRSIKEEFNKEPGTSDHNPDGIPERTIQELQLYEFGPVTFPAYPGASAGLRSMTDEMLVERMRSDPARMREVMRYALPAERADDEALTQALDALRAAHDPESVIAAIAARDFALLKPIRAEEEPHSEPEATTTAADAAAALPDGADAGHSVRDGSREPLFTGHDTEVPAWEL